MTMIVYRLRCGREDDRSLAALLTGRLAFVLAAFFTDGDLH
jgi:hypothetical protein